MNGLKIFQAVDVRARYCTLSRDNGVLLIAMLAGCAQISPRQAGSVPGRCRRPHPLVHRYVLIMHFAVGHQYTAGLTYWPVLTAEAKGAGYLHTGETVIAIQGWRDGVGHTNTIRILVVS